MHDGCRRHGGFSWPKYFQAAVILFPHNLLTREQGAKWFLGGGGGAETTHHRRMFDRSHVGTWRSADRCRPQDPTG